MHPSTEADAAGLLARISSEGVLAVALAEVSGYTTPETVAAALRHVPARWRALAAALSATSELRAPLLGAADLLEKRAGADKEDVLHDLLTRVTTLVDKLDRATQARETLPIGTMHALREAERNLIDEVWARSWHLPPEDRAVAHHYLEVVGDAINKTETDYISSDPATMLPSLAGAASVLLRLTLATVLGGAVGAALGSLIPGEDWVVETIKGAAPAIVAQSAEEVRREVADQKDHQRAYSSKAVSDKRDIQLVRPAVGPLPRPRTSPGGRAAPPDSGSDGPVPIPTVPSALLRPLGPRSPGY